MGEDYLSRLSVNKDTQIRIRLWKDSMPIIDEEAIANAIERVGPSVCTVGVLQLIQQGLFSTVPLQGMGSGLVIDKQGHILTNHHIVEEAEKVGAQRSTRG